MVILSLPLTFLSFSTYLYNNLQDKVGHGDFVIALDISFILNKLV